MIRARGIISVTVTEIDLSSEQCLVMDGQAVGIRKPIIALHSELPEATRLRLRLIRRGQQVLATQFEDKGSFVIAKNVALPPPRKNSVPCPNDDNDLHTYDSFTKICDFCGSRHYGDN